MSEKKAGNKQSETGLEIAVIGMAARFPGAKNIHEFWDNLKNGVECISYFSHPELEEAGISTELLNNPHYVKAASLLDDKGYFDASFFGYTHREAEVMDPQIRLFHECAWHALEDAGYNPDTYKEMIGIYAGATNSFEWQALSVFSGAGENLGGFAKDQLHSRDLLSMRISHKLNLKGPSFILFSACSTSLLAIHTACRGLLTGECSLALAGGASVSPKEKGGYMYQEGLIHSPDGHCRAFDANTRGTIFGEGIGVVLLKRAKDAAADRDHLYALVKASAVNNDGMTRVDFTAPSIKGQAKVIKNVLNLAQLQPEDITYVETHGTGTPLGDPIEISALTKAFKSDKKQFCRIGSVKSNLGHLEAAAGAASFIKTVLALKHKIIPPSLHFETPNPNIDFENSPFIINRELYEWDNNDSPLRGGVSSFGIGGTNVHVILEEAPVIGHSSLVIGEDKEERKYQLIVLSAKTASALDKMTENLVEYFKKNLLNRGNHGNPINPGPTLADAAYTLQVGRRPFKYRRMAVCRDSKQAISLLSSFNHQNLHSYLTKGDDDPKVIFMFPGQGAQYVNMGLDLYQTEPIFRQEMDRCFEILKPLLDYDIKEILYPFYRSNRSYTTYKSDKSHINQTEIAQPLLFIFEYALAKLLIKWGITPYVMMGHSIGEYTAAHLSGVFSLEDALKLVVLRGQLIQQLPGGSMASVSIPEQELLSLLKSNKGISLAAVNAPSLCVVSGPHEAVADFVTLLQKKGYETRRLHTSHAFHSQMMDPILEEFKNQVRQTRLNKPTLTFISNVTGQPITAEEAVNPGYWSTHLRNPVRFSPGIIKELHKGEPLVFVEVGPGNTLSTFVKLHRDHSTVPTALNLVRHPQENIPDDYHLQTKIGHLWLNGIKIDWPGFWCGQERHRVSLPPYPFKGQKYWLDTELAKLNTSRLGAFTPEMESSRKADIGDWFYLPLWEQAPPLVGVPGKTCLPGALNWLIFQDEQGIAPGLAARLHQENQQILLVKAGSGFSREGDDCYIINPSRSADYDSLFKELRQRGNIPQKIVHCWSIVGRSKNEFAIENFTASQERGFYSLLNIIQAMGKQSINRDIQVNVLTDNMQDVLGEGIRCPERSTLLGAIKVIPLEYSNIKCRCIDIPVPPRENIEEEAFLDTLFNEVVLNFPGTGEAVVALRGNHRWIRSFKPIHLESPGKTRQRLQEKGVYLITGGVGGIGLTLACFLAETVKARIILTGRSAFPTREEWSHWLSTHEENDEVSLKIKKLRELEALGSEVMIANADAADLEQMREVTTAAEKRFGPINGILHAAGIIDYEGVIQRRTRQMTERSIAAKVKGTLVLEALFKHRQLDFFLLFSCVGSLLYHDKFAQVGYIASNAFLETFALYKAGKDRPTPCTTAINWPDWLEKGMVMKALDKMHQGNKEKIAADLRRLSPVAVSPAEGTRIFQYILGQPRLYPWIAALPKDLNTMIRQMHTRMDQSPTEFETAEEIPAPEILYQRPELITPYVEPTNDIEKKLTGIFQRFFGIEQVGINDDFFELGGNSLIAMNILARIHKELNVKIPLVELFNRPTVHGLAPLLEKTGKDNNHPVESSEKKEYYPLSSAQKRVYIICEMDKNSTGYNQPEIVLLEGKLEKAKLEEAFHTLIKRHEMLRTSFCTLNEEPVQIVHDPGEIQFMMDYYQTSETEAKEIIDNYIKPFDLSRLSLFGVLLVKIGEEKHILVLNIHHIISDGPSNLIFFNELMMGYNGEGLPLLKLQYKDFSQWHNSLITSGKIEKQKKYWLNVFSRVLPVLHLPTDYRRPERQTFEGGLISFEISSRESGGLNQLAKDREVTLFMLLLALYAIMLSKISGQPDIVIGTPVSGAKPSDFDGVMGMFVNTLALRIFPHGDKTIGEFLKEIREHTLKAFENQDYQFEELVEQVVTQRDVSRNPLFDVMFVFQNFGTPVVKPTSSSPGTTASGLILKSYEYTVNSTRFDLILQGFEVDGRLYFTLDYRSALFEKERIQWFIQYFQDIISTVLQNPGQKISQIGLTTQWETQEILPQLHEDLKNET